MHEIGLAILRNFKMRANTRLKICEGYYLSTRAEDLEPILNNSQIPNGISFHDLLPGIDMPRKLGNFGIQTPFAFKIVDVDETLPEDPIKRTELINYAGHEFLLMLNILQFAFWVIKDNAVQIHHLVVSIQDSKQIINVRTLPEMGFNYCRVDSRYAPLFLDENEIEEALFIYNKFSELVEIISDQGKGLTALQERGHRLVRAYYFVNSARMHAHTALKLSEYCSALEALFSTGIAELQHKLGERVAYYLGEGADEYHNLYNIVINAYSIRSAVVHGDYIKKGKLRDIEAILEVAVNTDDIVRKSIRKILSCEDEMNRFMEIGRKDEKYQKELKEYFLNLQFGKPVDDKDDN